MAYQKTVAQVSELIEDMKSQYDGKLGHYQHWTVKRWQAKHGSFPVLGFHVTGWFPCGGHILLEWPVVDLDMAIAHLLYWRSREGRESIAGAGLMHSATLGFGGFELVVDNDGKILCKEDEIAIRNAISNGVFPQWSIDCSGKVSIVPQDVHHSIVRLPRELHVTVISDLSHALNDLILSLDAGEASMLAGRARGVDVLKKYSLLTE